MSTVEVVYSRIKTWLIIYANIVHQPTKQFPYNRLEAGHMPQIGVLWTQGFRLFLLNYLNKTYISALSRPSWISKSKFGAKIPLSTNLLFLTMALVARGIFTYQHWKALDSWNLHSCAHLCLPFQNLQFQENWRNFSFPPKKTKGVQTYIRLGGFLGRHFKFLQITWNSPCW